MAWYKDSKYFAQKNEEEFNKLYEPGSTPRWSGIYKCESCGHEAVHTAGQRLPPQNHHLHKVGQGKILWRLIVTDTVPA